MSSQRWLYLLAHKEPRDSKLCVWKLNRCRVLEHSIRTIGYYALMRTPPYLTAITALSGPLFLTRLALNQRQGPINARSASGIGNGREGSPDTLATSPPSSSILSGIR